MLKHKDLRQPEKTLRQEFPHAMTEFEMENLVVHMPREAYEMHPTKIAHKLPQIFSNRQFADIQLRIKALVFPCHSEVMALHSDLFAQVATTPYRPLQQFTVNLKHDVDNAAIKKILDWCYTGIIETNFE